MILTALLMLSNAADAMQRLGHAVAGSGQTQIVICSDVGARTVVLNSDGTEVPAPQSGNCQHCPDCTLAFMLAVVASDPGQADQLTSGLILPGHHLVTARSHKVSQSARAPPFKA